MIAAGCAGTVTMRKQRTAGPQYAYPPQTAPRRGRRELNAYTLDNSNPALQDLDDFEVLTDLKTYTVTDGYGGTATSQLSVTIVGVTDNTPPDAALDLASVVEDTPPNPIVGNVLANDIDIDGDTLTVTNPGTYSQGGAGGTLVLNADGSYTYTLDNTNPGVDALNDGDTLLEFFSYNVSDGQGGLDGDQLRITVHGVTDNSLPFVNDDLNTIVEDTSPNPILGNVLFNDSDPDGDSLTVTNPGTIQLLFGTLILNADGSYTYTLDNANPAVDALDSGDLQLEHFFYQVSDGEGGTTSAQLIITINGVTDNTPPDARNDTTTVREDTPPNPVSGNLLDNDTDVDNDTLVVTNPGTHAISPGGTLVLNPDGSYQYTLDNADPVVDGLDTGEAIHTFFVYSVSDGHGGTNTAILDITIEGVTDTPNTAPDARDDSGSVQEDVTLTASGNVLANDTDADNDALVVTSTGTLPGTHGSWPSMPTAPTSTRWTTTTRSCRLVGRATGRLTSSATRSATDTVGAAGPTSGSTSAAPTTPRPPAMTSTSS
jgi:VCBS repeat-containing protein